MRWAVGIVASVLGVSCMAGPCRAEGPLAGYWEGAIAQPAGELRMSVDIAGEGDAVKGTFDLPAAAVYHWPLDVSQVSPRVRLKLPTGVVLEGQLRKDSISGTVPSPTGGHTDPFHLVRATAPPLPYKLEEVRFRSGTITLVGTLRLPLARGRHPALFLLQGSGDSDREAESFYADHFAKHGIATLVYDKRGTGSSGGDYREESFDDFAGDALAGIHYLMRRKEIDPKRVGLYGRSHGGIVASLAASRSKDVAFVINVSGAGVPPYQQMTHQTVAEMRRDGFSQADSAEAVAYMDLKWAVARAGGEGWDSLQVATQNARGKRWAGRVQLATKLEDIVPSWKLQMGYEPLPALERVHCPILCIFGELDTSTPIPETIANYKTGLAKAGNKDLTIQVFPGADHALLEWPKPGSPLHWPVLADGYLNAMTNWIEKHTAP